MHETEKWNWSRSFVSYSSRPHGLQPTRLLHTWDFPGKSTGVGCCCLLRLSMWDECNCAVVWAFFGIAFLWDWNENWLFPVLWPLLRFPNLLACWMQHFHSIIFTLTIRKFHKTFPTYFSATSSATQSVQPQLKFPNILILLTHSFIKCEWVITAEHPANHNRIWGSGRKQPTAKNPFLWSLLIHREK